jgi:hypothetical protein
MTALPGAFALALCRRLCSGRAFDEIVTPIIADLQHEHGNAAARSSWARRWILLRGYAALLRALGVYAPLTPARHVRECWAGSEAPGWQLLRCATPRAAAALAIVLLPLVWSQRYLAQRVQDPGALLLLMLYLMPGFLIVAVPIALAIGLALAVIRLDRTEAQTRPTQSRVAPATAVSIVMAVAMFVLMNDVIPRANQAFREYVGRPRDIPKGSREMTMSELGRSAREARARGDRHAAFKFDTEWHKKLAIPAACIAWGPLAVVIASRRRRLRGVVSAVGLLSAYAVYFLAVRLADQAAVAGRLWPAWGWWIPVAVLLVATAAAASSTESLRAASDRG